MTDRAPALYEPNSLRFTFSALWRVAVILSLVWAAGGTLDGADLQELIAVPLVMAAWALGFFILDRWVVKAGGHWYRSPRSFVEVKEKPRSEPDKP
jgi:hypothetical protein